MAIELRAVSKQYALFDRPADRLKQMLLGGVSRLGARSLGWTAPRLYREFHALRDVSFSVARGEVLGIIGRNGAGKSTLLQIICGTLQPTSGSVQVRGRIAALLELGAGFNPEFTGRENIVMAATILGLSAAEIDQRMASIIEFSGIAEFIDQPVKTYSSGMYVRLAFSVATSIDPDILVIDEALSVGDGEFARRSFDRIMALKDKGATILFCSHAMYHVQVLCNRALWMEHGRMRMIVQHRSPRCVQSVANGGQQLAFNLRILRQKCQQQTLDARRRKNFFQRFQYPVGFFRIIADRHRLSKQIAGSCGRRVVLHEKKSIGRRSGVGEVGIQAEDCAEETDETAIVSQDRHR
jgi:ABC-type polysaccharide/polyol phosphate transport system ATPase subunit